MSGSLRRQRHRLPVLLGLAVALVLAASVWRILPMLQSGGGPGDGRTVASYGFDLSNSLVDIEHIVAAGFARDGVPALVGPATMSTREVPAYNDEHRGKYLVPEDRVIAVEIGGEARAYPLRVLNWHEIVNDTLGGVPIAVTYHPLCDSVVVFGRRIGDETLQLGVSGLLHNSNLLMYDRRDPAGSESLWSQLLARAVTGPAARAGRALPILPASLVRWDRWREEHPAGTVLRPEARRLRRYQRNPYGNYLRTGKLRFPVEPLPPPGGPRLMERVLVVSYDGRRQVLPLSSAGDDGPPVPEELATLLRVDGGIEPSYRLAPESGVTAIHCLWFGWFAHHPKTALTELVEPAR